MSFVTDTLGITDTKAQKRAAEAQAAAIRESAEQTRKQSQLAAAQAAEQQRLASERAAQATRLQEQQSAKPQEVVTVDTGAEASDLTPTRKRRQYQAPTDVAGSIRI